MKSSVQQYARELDRLCRNNIPISQAFDMLENKAVKTPRKKHSNIPL